MARSSFPHLNNLLILRSGWQKRERKESRPFACLLWLAHYSIKKGPECRAFLIRLGSGWCQLLTAFFVVFEDFARAFLGGGAGARISVRSSRTMLVTNLRLPFSSKSITVCMSLTSLIVPNP